MPLFSQSALTLTRIGHSAQDLPLVTMNELFKVIMYELNKNNIYTTG